MDTPAEIHTQLRDRLVNGEFTPGQRLKPEDLRQDYGCSVSTLREILHRLAFDGLLIYQEQRGFRHPPASAKLLNDLTRFRILLECEGATQAVEVGDVDWEARLTAAHHKLSHIEKRVRTDAATTRLRHLLNQSELEFHQTLIDPCNSNTLKQTHAQIYHRFRQQLATGRTDLLFFAENVQQHRGILEAALAHDREQVTRLIRAHLEQNIAEEPEAA